MDVFKSSYTAEELETAIKSVLDPYNEGKKAEYDAFWDKYQQNGTRYVYSYAFSGIGWTSNTFQPKYPLYTDKRLEGYMMFRDSKIDDISEVCPLALSWSQYAFNSTSIVHIGEVEVHDSATGLFSQSKNLESVDKLTFGKGISSLSGDIFTGCISLKNITFGGEIRFSISFQWSPLLTVDSMKSIITHLKDYSNTGSAFAYTLTFDSDCWNALEADSASPNGSTWIEYVEELGWNAA